MSRDSEQIKRTWNKLVADKRKRDNAPATIDDTRRPQTKSPVHCRIAWNGDAIVEPGQAVKLVAALVDPAFDESAPFEGLKFRAEPFAENEELVDYALTMDEIAARVKQPAELTDRDEDDEGELTMDNPVHGIVQGDAVDLEWADPDNVGQKLRRDGMIAGVVDGDEIPVTGGFGSVLPTTSTEITVIRSTEVGVGVMPEAYWALVHVTDDAHDRAKIITAGTQLESSDSGGLRIIWKGKLPPNDPPEDPPEPADLWCVVSMSSGIGDHYQIVRGTVVEQLSPDHNVFRLSVEQTLEQYSASPGATIFCSNSPAQLSARVGVPVWAIYSEAAATLDGDEFEGDVTEQTDGDTAQITLDNPDHGIVAGRRIDVEWETGGGGERTGMNVTAVAGVTIDVDGGTGDDMPAETYSCTVTLLEESVDWETFPTPFGEIPELVVKITSTIDAADTPPTGNPGVGTGTVYRLAQDLLGDLVAYEAISDFAEWFPVPSTTHTTPAIVNTHPYPAGAGLYPIEFMGTVLNGVFGDPDPEDTEPYAAFTLTGFDLHGHAGWNAVDDLVFVSTGGVVQWIDASEFEGPEGPQGDTGATGAPGTPGADGDTISEGYCIEHDGTNPKVDHLNQMTSAAGTTAGDLDKNKFQFWMHEPIPGTAARTDAKWTTVTGFDDTKTQLLGHINGTWHAKTIADWLKLLEGWNPAVDQSIGHDAGGEPMWQDDDDCD
jgi:hypothetical protein